jgi:hypothetical protein
MNGTVSGFRVGSCIALVGGFELAVVDRSLYIAAGIGGAHVLARLDVSFDAARLRGVRVGAGRLAPDVQVLRVDERGASLLTQSGRDFTLSDYGVESFTSGWMGSCL